MALRLSEMPWFYQMLLFFAVAVGIVLLGEMVDLPPVLPVRGALAQKEQLEQRHQQLVNEVARLQAVRQQHQAFRTRLEALDEQLRRLQTFVPSERRTDDFIRLLQGSASNARVALRRITSSSVVYREFYAEMPFQIEMDGAYYDVGEFFDRLGKATRIVNVAALGLTGVSEQSGGKYTYSPETTVTGTCTVTTFFTPSEEELAAAAPPEGAPQQPPPPPGRQ